MWTSEGARLKDQPGNIIFSSFSFSSSVKACRRASILEYRTRQYFADSVKLIAGAPLGCCFRSAAMIFHFFSPMAWQSLFRNLVTASRSANELSVDQLCFVILFSVTFWYVRWTLPLQLSFVWLDTELFVPSLRSSSSWTLMSFWTIVTAYKQF